MREIGLFRGMAAIGLLLLFSGLTFSEGRVAASRWTSSSPKADGLDEEWPSDYLYYDKESDVDYAFRNDGRNLYIHLVVRNSKPLSSIEATGIAIYGYPAEAKQRNNGARFIKRTVKADRFIAMLESQGRVLTEEEKKELRAKPQHPIFMAVAIDREGETLGANKRQANVDPPAFGMTKQADAAIYEFRIPLASHELTPAGVGAEPGPKNS